MGPREPGGLWSNGQDQCCSQRGRDVPKRAAAHVVTCRRWGDKPRPTGATRGLPPQGGGVPSAGGFRRVRPQAQVDTVQAEWGGQESPARPRLLGCAGRPLPIRPPCRPERARRDLRYLSIPSANRASSSSIATLSSLLSAMYLSVTSPAFTSSSPIITQWVAPSLSALFIWLFRLRLS